MPSKRLAPAPGRPLTAGFDPDGFPVWLTDYVAEVAARP
jgi:hypothetical protein